MWFKQEFEKIRRRFPAYRIAIFYVYCKEETVLSRAKKRGEVTGRFVPEEMLKTSMANTRKSVEILGPLADFLVKLDNEERTPILDVFVDHSHSFVSVQNRFAAEAELDPFPLAHPVLRILSDAVKPTSFTLPFNIREALCKQSGSTNPVQYIPIRHAFRHRLLGSSDEETADVLQRTATNRGVRSSQAPATEANVAMALSATWDSLCLTPAAAVNVDVHSRKVVGIPAKAEYFSYCEGAVCKDHVRIGMQGCKWVSEGKEELDNILRLMLRGGFVYFDKDYEIVGINVIVWHFQGGHIIRCGHRVLSHDSALRSKLEQEGRLVKLEDAPAYRDNDLTCRAWLHSGEFPDAPFGGFFYCTKDPETPDFLYPVMVSD